MLTSFVYFLCACVVDLWGHLAIDNVAINAVIDSPIVLTALGLIAISSTLISIAWYTRNRISVLTALVVTTFSEWYTATQLSVLIHQTWAALEYLCIPVTKTVCGVATFSDYVPYAQNYPPFLQLDALAFEFFILGVISLFALAKMKYRGVKALFLTLNVASVFVMFLIIGLYFTIPTGILDPNGILNMQVTNFFVFFTNGQVLGIALIAFVGSLIGFLEPKPFSPAKIPVRV